MNFTGLNRASGEEQVRRLIYEYIAGDNVFSVRQMRSNALFFWSFFSLYCKNIIWVIWYTIATALKSQLVATDDKGRDEEASDGFGMGRAKFS